MRLKSLTYLLLLLAIQIPATIFAQAISFNATVNKTTVQTGENFKVSFTINSKANGFSPPSFNGFTVLSGPNPSSQSSMQWINGNFTQSISQSYSYILAANKEGTLTIGSASISAGNSTYKTNPITINVVKGQNYAGNNSQVPGSSAPSNKQNKQSSSSASYTTPSDDLFVRTYVSRNKVYKGEQITLTHKLYTALPSVNLIDIKPPSYAGFWSEQIDGNKTITPQNEVLNGKAYKVAEISKTVLFPQKDGTIKIEPIQVECDVQIVKQRNASNFVEEMFYGPKVSYYTNERMKIRSNPVTVNVLDLPLKGKPSDYSGAVGNFNISAEISKNSIKANEALDLKITLSGAGNIKLIDNLPFEMSPDFEVYDPKITDAVNVTGGGVSGKRIFEYVIIPLHEGKYEIPPVNFSYFDPKKGQYITISSPRFDINVGKGDSRNSQIVTSSQKDINYINSDIRFIKNNNTALNFKTDYFWGSNIYFSLFAFPPLLFAGFMIFYRKQVKNKGDIAYVRNRRARKVSRQKLRKAKEFMDSNQPDNFFVEISQAIWGYTGDKFNITLSELSLQTVKEHMSEKNINEDKQTALLNILNDCEFARFAPGNSTEKMNKLYSDAMKVIMLLESEKI